MIKREWLQFYKEPPPKSRHGRIIQSWDTASKAGELCDYSVCTTWLEQENRFYLIDVVRERFDYPDLKRRVVAEVGKHNANVVLIEDKSSGTNLIQDLRHEGKVRPIAITPDADKITRMAAQSAKIEAEYVHLPEQAPWLADFMTELLQFPYGGHDDQVDSVSQFLGWVTRPRVGPRIRRL